MTGFEGLHMLKALAMTFEIIGSDKLFKLLHKGDLFMMLLLVLNI